MFYRYLFYYIMNANLQIKKQLKEISNEEANSSCFDCGNKPANWASISNGIFLCLDCSSEHRGYGIEISFIRSITMDQWTQEQVNIMKIGGNQRLKDFLTNYEIPENMDRKIIYFSNLMNFYRKQIKAESMGRINMEPLPSKEVFWNKMNSYDRNNLHACLIPSGLLLFALKVCLRLYHILLYILIKIVKLLLMKVLI